MSESSVARLVHYSGNVQGVGFRATAVRIAGRFAVTGWARNVLDGRVELLAEGAEPEVERFLKALRDSWSDCISNEDIQSLPASGKYKYFDIAR